VLLNTFTPDLYVKYFRDLKEMIADGPPSPEATAAAIARFVEVKVDLDLGVLRIARIVSVTDGGRIFNEKLARSQIMGATIGGIGMAALEKTVTDPGAGGSRTRRSATTSSPSTPTCPTSTSPS
jgi:CO/xanthine dehydrogenase Mo-binding subunit